MINKKTITIGIPAYNEEGNIAYILRDILAQKEIDYTLNEVIVASDGSSDKTCNKVRAFDDKRITLFDFKDRQGAAARQNFIMEKADSDILILLNADIKLDGETFVNKLIQPIIAGSDLTSSNMHCVKPSGFFESIISYSLEFKNYVFEHYKNGLNVYTCHGVARAFSKNLYKTFKFGDSVGEDAYSYFYTVFNKYNYAYAKDAVCYIKCVCSYKDNLKQSTRNFNGIKAFAKKYGYTYVNSEYKIDLKLLTKGFIIYLLKNPIKMILYCIIVLSTALSSFFVKTSNTWSIAKSSKVLRKE